MSLNRLHYTLSLDPPAMLQQMASMGRTLIENFEIDTEAVGLVFVLLTRMTRSWGLMRPGLKSTGHV